MSAVVPGRGARAARAALGWVLCAALVRAGAAAPATDAAGPAPEPSAHAAHHLKLDADAVRRVRVDIELPQIHLVRDDDKPVVLAEEIRDGRPVYVDFIYTTCTAICPVTSASFAALQDRLGADRERVHMLSISIDPEEDTPRRLREFRQKFGAGAQWHHYTGTMAASVAVQRAFGVFTGDKMGHTPVTLFRAAPGQSWVRLDGLASPEQLYDEVRPQLAAR